MTENATTVVAIPPAGGFASFFSPLAGHLESSVRLVGVDLPGHGLRRGEPLLQDIVAMARDILTRIRPRLAGAYALLGHSMGALIAYELVGAIAAQQLPLPRHLFVSACAAPKHIRLRPGVAELPDEAFWAYVAGLGGMPNRFFDNPKIMALFEPIFRADFRAVAAYRPRPVSPLPLPFTVLGGREDGIAPKALAAWQDHTTRPLVMRTFSGGHFYLLDHLPQVATVLTAGCASRTRPGAEVGSPRRERSRK